METVSRQRIASAAHTWLRLAHDRAAVGMFGQDRQKGVAKVRKGDFAPLGQDS